MLGAMIRAMRRIASSIVERLEHLRRGLGMGIFFDQERRLIASIEREKDLAASMADPSRRRSRLRRVGDLARQLPHTRMERLLLRSP